MLTKSKAGEPADFMARFPALSREEINPDRSPIAPSTLSIGNLNSSFGPRPRTSSTIAGSYFAKQQATDDFFKQSKASTFTGQHIPRLFALFRGNWLVGSIVLTLNSIGSPVHCSHPFGARNGTVSTR
jgi:hypothetical protein